jgi:hypothetical protein
MISQVRKVLFRFRLPLLLVLAVGLGYLMRMAIAGDFTGSLISPAGLIGLADESKSPVSGRDGFEVIVQYQGGRFRPDSVTVGKGNYLSITNISKSEKMWLTSDDPELVTPRGYGESERLKVLVIREGTFRVINKLNPSAQLTVTVNSKN